MVGLQKYFIQHLRRIGVYVSMDSSAHELFCGPERIFQIWQSPRPQIKVLKDSLLRRRETLFGNEYSN